MRQSEWYENRILWRAKKLCLQSYAWQNFSSTNDSAAKSVEAAAADFGAPLFLFWSSDAVWTLLTDQFLIGKLDSKLSSVHLDKLQDVSTVLDEGLAASEGKRMAEIICAGDQKKFWTPAGNAHFALRNILNMFPINIP